jgi:hypothetical protein
LLSVAGLFSSFSELPIGFLYYSDAAVAAAAAAGSLVAKQPFY